MKIVLIILSTMLLAISGYKMAVASSLDEGLFMDDN